MLKPPFVAVPSVCVCRNSGASPVLVSLKGRVAFGAAFRGWEEVRPILQ